MVEKNKEAISITQLDLSKFFDKESLLDCLESLYKSQIRGKLYKLIYKLNKDTRITVRTAVGDSEPEELNEIVAQGSLEAAMISSNNLS